jgi:hypothetical protein
MRRFGQVVFLILLSIFAFVATEAQAAKGDRCNDEFKDKAGNLRPDKVAAYVMHELYEAYRKADKNCDGKLSIEEIQAFERSTEVAAQIDGAQHYVRRTLDSGEKIPLDKNGEPPAPIVGSLEPANLDSTCDVGWKFFLRSSAENIGTFDCPKDLKSASGAQFGYTRDGVSGNTSWSAKGVAALAYVWRNSESHPYPYIAGFSLSPWASFNRLTNSLQSLKSKETDLLSYGGTTEIAIGELLGGTQYFRGKTQINSDFEGMEKSWSTTAEWQPVSYRYGISASHRLGPYLLWEVDPILRSIYSNRRNGSLDPIFANRDNVFRAGPVLALNVTPVPGIIEIPQWLQSSSVSATAEWLRDMNTDQIYRLYNVALNIAVSSTSNLGLQINYQYGQLEETGQKVNAITAGLAAKW